MRRRFVTLVRFLRTSLIAIPLLVASVLGGTAFAAAPTQRVDIVKVSGLIDPLNRDLLSSSIRRANREGALLLVWQMNSTGGTVGVSGLLTDMAASRVPIAVWVGGSARPRAYGPAFTLFQAADFRGAAHGARVGAATHLAIDDALDKGVVQADPVPTLVEFLGDISGKQLRGQTIDLGTAGTGFRKDVQFTFSQLSIVPKLFHTAASPDVAFVMLVLALALVVFEFFTAGVGVAAGTGVLFGILSSYGLGVLPAHWWAVALVGVSILGFAIDVQAGAPRFWSVVGGVAYVAGAVAFYHGLAVSPWVIAVVGGLLALFMISGMPAMVRTRFSTPTIGRQSMIGTMGVALSGVSPEGTVEINGAPWRARTNRATPIPAGDAVRVVAIDGLLLEVEPSVGGARDAHH